MSKLTRQTQTQFGSTVNAASEVGKFGSGAAGSPAYTGSITLMQSLTAWARGWAAETIANNRPFLEDMNAVDCVFGYQLSYLFQEGIAEYDAGTTYFLNSICQSSGTMYQVINDSSGAGISGISPTNTTYWTVVQTKGLGAWTSISNNTIYQALTDLWVIGNGPFGVSANWSIVTDSSSSPSTVRAQFQTNGTQTPANVTISSFVRKGDYYEINISGATPTTYILSLGS